MLFDAAPEDPNYNPLPEERPGGFDWGAGGGRENGDMDANRQRTEVGANEDREGIDNDRLQEGEDDIQQRNVT